MSRPAHICIALLDDPVYKQSAIRVADSLAAAGHKVTLIGRRLEGEAGPEDPSFHRVRFSCLFREGKGLYIEMNVRIFFYLLFHKADLVCAVNLDTIFPVWIISVLKGIPRVYDARELFTELAEVVARPTIQKAWLWVERRMVPRFRFGYAVCQSIADVLNKRYNVGYAVVRNMTVLTNRMPGPRPFEQPYLLYQGAVNYGRGMDALIPAMQYINLPLVICGTGNYIEATKVLVSHYGLQEKVRFTGQLPPEQLFTYTWHAYAGINLVEREGLNQYFSLPNKLFDYIHAAVPQVTMDYPEYQRVQQSREVAVLIPEVRLDLIVDAVKLLTSDPALYERLKENCRLARLELNWQKEEPILLDVYARALQ